jgi:hypothetical protein
MIESMESLTASSIIPIAKQLGVNLIYMLWEFYNIE